MNETSRPFAAHVGRRIRLAREAAGLSLPQLAQALGAAVEELHRNELGYEPVSPARLLALSSILDAPIAAFFSGLDHFEPLSEPEPPAQPPPEPATRLAGMAPPGPLVAAEPGLTDQARALRVLEAFRGIGSEALRRDLLALLRHF